MDSLLSTALAPSLSLAPSLLAIIGTRGALSSGRGAMKDRDMPSEAAQDSKSRRFRSSRSPPPHISRCFCARLMTLDNESKPSTK